MALLLAAMPIAGASSQTTDTTVTETCNIPVATLLEGDPLRNLNPRALKFIERGRGYFANGRYREALAMYDCALSIRVQMQTEAGSAAMPGAETGDRPFGALWDAIGDARMALHRYAAALEAYEFFYAVAQSIVERAGGSPHLGLYQLDLAMSYVKMGNVHAARREFAEAFKDYEEGLAIARLLSEINPEAPAPLHMQAFIHGAMSFAWSARGDAARAEAHDLAGLQIDAALLKKNPSDPFLRYDYAQALARVGGRGGRSACRHLTDAHEILRDLDRRRQLNVPQQEMALMVGMMQRDRCNSQGGASNP
jgi:tetratricopeptide (TPR) repeat protein